MNIDYYGILGVTKDAIKEEIKEAYHACALKYHPDKNKDKNAGALFILVKEAYEVLSDDEKRKQYDAGTLNFDFEDIFRRWGFSQEESEEEQSKNFKLDDVMDNGESKVKVLPALSGILQQGEDNIFYQTVFTQKDGKYTPIVITSWGGIVPVIRHADPIDPYQCIHYLDFIYRFRHDVSFDPNMEINTIDNEGIKLLSGTKRLELTGKEIYNPIIKELKSYYYHPSSFEYDIVASNVIQSYIYQTLGRVFYLVLQGRKGSGKSVLLQLLSYLSMNGKYGGRSSLANNVRKIGFHGITLCQDEFEKMSKDEISVVVGVFNSGFNRGGSYEFVNTAEKKLEKQSVSIKTFGPKNMTANELDSFPDSFIDRCYILQSFKSGIRTKDIYQVIDEDFKRFQTIRNNTLAYCMIHWIQIRQDIEYVKEQLMNSGLFGREVDKYSIILGIIKHFKGEEYSKTVWDYIKKKLPPEHEETEKHNLMDEIILDAIVSRYDKEYIPMIEVPNAYLHELLCKKLGKPIEGRGSVSDQKPYHILHSLDIISEKREKISKSGRAIYLVYTEKLRQALIRNNYIILSRKIPTKPTGAT